MAETRGTIKSRRNLTTSHQLTIEVSEDVYQELTRQAQPFSDTVETVAAEWMEGALKELNSDPLIQASGSLHADVNDLGARHDYYIVEAMAKELQGSKEE